MSVTQESPAGELAGAPEEGRRERTGWLIALYTAVVLLGSGLLFAVEPMVAKFLLPVYGGSPMVWNTAVLFFQGALLVGYCFAHWSQGRLGPRRQPWLQLVLVLPPLALLPVALPGWAVAPGSAPVALWLLLVLAVMVGAPFAVLATTGPIIQRWYSWSGLPRSNDPYFLYAASNIGSLVALLSYPFVLEPSADLATQARWWAVGYGVFAVLLAACGVVTWRRARGSSPVDTEPAEPAEPAEAAPAESIDWRRRVRWLALAFVPSSLMLGVTTHISTDIAPVPLMWVVPLAIYLLTFIVAFGVRSYGWLGWTVVGCGAGAVLFPWAVVLMDDSVPPVVAIVLDLVLLTVAGLACHGLLAMDRPAASRLTEFFLVVSAGGVLGGAFNGLLAPVVFDWVVEFPLVVGALGVLPAVLARLNGWRVGWAAGRVRPALLFGLCGLVALVAFAPAAWAAAGTALFAVLGLVLVARRPLAMAVAGMLSVALLIGVQAVKDTTRERTFFGQYEVYAKDGRQVFVHGNTIHGFQLIDPARRMTPVSYYAATGPMGDVFAAYGAGALSDRVGVVGLGAGGLAAYGRPGQRMDFYEIDPAVVRIAKDTRWFTYLRDCRCDARTITGDGRLEVRKVPDGGYGLMILDAFSSDAVPTHLLTREAIRLYTRKLRPGGILVFNISNRNLDLAPMLGATSRAAGLVSLTARDPEPRNPVAFGSAWVVMARTAGDLAPLRARNPRWHPIEAAGPVWTDSYSSLFGVLGHSH